MKVHPLRSGSAEICRRLQSTKHMHLQLQVGQSRICLAKCSRVQLPSPCNTDRHWPRANSAHSFKIQSARHATQAYSYFPEMQNQHKQGETSKWNCILFYCYSLDAPGTHLRMRYPSAFCNQQVRVNQGQN